MVRQLQQRNAMVLSRVHRFLQLIPEGAGTVKTHGWLFFRLFASFLILAGASK